MRTFDIVSSADGIFNVFIATNDCKRTPPRKIGAGSLKRYSLYTRYQFLSALKEPNLNNRGLSPTVMRTALESALKGLKLLNGKNVLSTLHR